MGSVSTKTRRAVARTAGVWRACEAADYAYRQNFLGGDHCGRYAWIQGSIGKRNTDGSLYDFKQYYPRDFNLVALSGNITSLMHVQGPVAAKGDVVASYLELNWGKREEIALLAGGKVALAHGTVNGMLHYGTTFTHPGVTFVDATAPTAPNTPSLVTFDTGTFAFDNGKLLTMSQSIRDRYDVNGTAEKEYGTNLRFKGTDPELNVFKLASDKFVNTYSYIFDVPAGSAMVITVTGTAPEIKYAGFSGKFSAKNLLWNFPDAQTLAIRSTDFSGSVLAPKAAATLQNGNLYGSVVVASAVATTELYQAPLHLGCSGGFCFDKTWSCSSDTSIADSGKAADIDSEAGFLEIEGGAYTSEGHERISATHRVWYSFHPAKSGRKNKPLAVFFNGGPGAGTTPVLFAFNTAPKTFELDLHLQDHQTPQVKDLITNPNSWTSFANLLYIDAPATGFSYPLKDADGQERDIGTDIDRDASNFVRVLLRFLGRHPALRKNRVILVGESYGGVRATLMLKQLYAGSTSFTDPNDYQDSQLSSELQEHFGVAFGTATPTAAQLATQFGHQVLIEPVLVGQEQIDSYNGYPPADVPRDNPDFTDSTTCKPNFADDNTPCWYTRSSDGRLPTCDDYDCDQAPGWINELIEQAATKLTKVATLSEALGVNVKTIAWMNDETRKTRAYGRASTATFGVKTVRPVDMADAANFDSLNPDDNYLVLMSDRVFISHGYHTFPWPPNWPGYTRAWDDDGIGAVTGSAFATHVLNEVKSFLTVARHDAVVWTPSIPRALDLLLGNVEPLVGVQYRPSAWNTTNNHGARPGLIDLVYDSGTTKSVTMPHAYSAGHTISVRAPFDLLNDVSNWYRYF